MLILNYFSFFFCDDLEITLISYFAPILEFLNNFLIFNLVIYQYLILFFSFNYKIVFNLYIYSDLEVFLFLVVHNTFLYLKDLYLEVYPIVLWYLNHLVIPTVQPDHFKIFHFFTDLLYLYVVIVKF